jgi:DNA-binding NarL/FixJ family response regulator
VSSGEAKVRVMIVEDEGLYRDLLRIVLSQHNRLEVVGAYADGESALAAVAKIRPQVAILDIELRSALNGIQLGLELRKKLPSLGIVLLSNHGDPQFVSSLPQEAISGWSYLLKKSVSDVQALSRAIEGAAAGFVVLDSQLVSGMHPRAGGLLGKLTPRQSEILERIAQGYTNGAIAQQLVLSEKSIENQINQIYQQLQIERETNSVHPRVKAVLTYLRESQFRGLGANPRVN